MANKKMHTYKYEILRHVSMVEQAFVTVKAKSEEAAKDMVGDLLENGEVDTWEAAKTNHIEEDEPELVEVDGEPVGPSKPSEYAIMFSRLVRETAQFKVDADSPEEAKAKALLAYEGDVDLEWEPDCEWGAEEGTHYLVGDDGLVEFNDIEDVDLPDEDEEEEEED